MHALAAIAAIALAPIVITMGPGGGARWIVALYALAVVGLFGVSAGYHTLAWGTRAHGLMCHLDHSMIFVFIAATYTPLAVFVLEGRARPLILALVWGGAIAGILRRFVWPDAPRWVAILPYLAVGWAAILVVDDMWVAMGVAGFVLLLVGGLLYSIGAAVYATARPNPWPRWFGHHEVFHLLVVVAVAAHYVTVNFFALPKA
jgi:hemolysin III